MRTQIRLIFLFGIICFASLWRVEAYDATSRNGFQAFGACGYPSNDPRAQTRYRRYHAKTIREITTTNTTTCTIEGVYEVSSMYGSGPYVRVSYDDDCMCTGDPIHTKEKVSVSKIDGLWNDCGAYFSDSTEYSLATGVNAAVMGLDVSEINGGNSFTTITETHSDTSWQVVETVVSTNEDNTTTTTVTTSSGELDGSFTVPSNIDDGDDKGYECDCSGMPRWFVTEPYINLWIKDTPVFYRTSLGEKIGFELAYKQRDTRPLDDPIPVTGWNHNWFSYIQFTVPHYAQMPDGDPSQMATNIIGWSVRGVGIRSGWVQTNDFSQWVGTVYLPGGGESHFEYGSGTDPQSGVTLMPLDGTNASSGFRLVHPDGSQDVYGLLTGTRTIWGRSDYLGGFRLFALQARDITSVSTSVGKNDYGDDTFTPISAPGEPLDYIAGEALLTKRIDPYGNVIKLDYVTEGTNYFLSKITDYDNKETKFTYTNGMLTGVSMPYGKTATMGYSGTLLTSITDAQGMNSQIGYTDYPTNVFSRTMHNYIVTQLTTPYGTTTFDHQEAEFFDRVVAPPRVTIYAGAVDANGNYSMNLATNSGGYITNFVGNVGGEGRVNRSIGVVNPDASRELYMYRNDSSTILPKTLAPGEFPAGLTDTGAGDLPDSWLSGRASFYWNRKVMAGITYTNVNDLKDEMNLARMSHYLPKNDVFVSDAATLVREPSPDGIVEGVRTYYARAQNGLYYAPTETSVTGYRTTADGNFLYFRTDYNRGLPSAFVETYTTPEGGTAERTYSYNYTTVTANPGEAVHWDYLMLSGISTPAGTWTISGLEDVPTVVDGMTISLPKYRQMTITDPEWNVQTNFFNDRQQLTGILYPNGSRLTNIYGSDGFLSQSINVEAQSTNSFSFVNGLLNTRTNPLGLPLSYRWDKLDRLTQVSFPDGTTVSNWYGRLDVVGRKDRLNHWSYAQFNSMRQPYHLVDANGKATDLTWCSCGGPDSITDPLNGTTIYTRNNVGNVVAATSSDNSWVIYNRNILGQVTNITSSDGLNLKYEYNIQGLVTKMSNPAGQLFETIYDIADRPKYVTDERNVTVTYDFDGLGRIKQRLDALQGAENFSYDGRGLYQYEDALHHFTTYGYDPAGRLSAVTNANQEFTLFGYNPAGEITSLTDGRNNTKWWAYDSYGRQIAETNANNVLVRTNGYDANSRLTAQWTAAKGLTRYSYDNNGNLTNVVHPVSGTVRYGYDALNRLTNVIDSLGQTVLNYQNFGAFRGALQSEDGPWGNDTVVYGYTGHKLTAITQGTWSEGIGYDTSLRPKVFSSPAGTFTYTFKGAGRQIDWLDMPGHTATYGYDPLGQIKSIDLKHGSTVLDSHTYDYDPTGLTTNITRLNGVKAAYGYDPVGQLTSAQGFEANDTPRLNENFGYSYDASHNLAFRTNNTLIQNFTSDPLNQLQNVSRNNALTVAGQLAMAPTSLTINDQSAQVYSDLTFAATSGLTISDGQNTFLAKVTDNGVTRSNVMTAFLPASVNFGYDLNGNLLSDGQRGYAYDDENQLIRVTVTNRWKSEFAYDGLGRRRIAKEFVWNGSWLQTNETRYVYDGMLVMQERDGNNNTLVSYTRGLDLSGTRQRAGGIGGLLARTDSSGSAFYHNDAGGNITAMVNSSGNVVARYLYDPFGNLLAKSGLLADANRYRFSSKEVHANSGMYYYGFRFYEPNLQRWLNQDPLGELGGLNLYGFVENDPINRWDLLGLSDYYELRRNSKPGDDLYPGRNPGEKFWEFMLRSIGNTLANPSFQNSMAFGGPGSNFGGAQNQNLRIKCSSEGEGGLAGRLADRVQPLPASIRPNTVTVIKAQNGHIIIGRNQGGVFNAQIQQALKAIPPNEFCGECSEVNAISRALNKNVDLGGAIVNTAYVRGAASESGLHGKTRLPCDVCDKLVSRFVNDKKCLK